MKYQNNIKNLKIYFQLATKWINNTEETVSNGDIQAFSSGQLQEFLDQLIMAPALATDKIEKMEKNYTSISSSKNSEVRFRWLRVCIKAQYEGAIDDALAMVTEQGRMKFTRPLYRDLNGWDAARARAITTFKKNRPSMHFTTAGLVAKDLKIGEIAKF